MPDSEIYTSLYILVTEFLPTILMNIVVGMSLFGFLVKMGRNDGDV